MSVMAMPFCDDADTALCCVDRWTKWFSCTKRWWHCTVLWTGGQSGSVVRNDDDTALCCVDRWTKWFSCTKRWWHGTVRWSLGPPGVASLSCSTRCARHRLSEYTVVEDNEGIILWEQTAVCTAWSESCLNGLVPGRFIRTDDCESCSYGWS